MTKKNLLKSMLVITGLLLQLNLSAQASPITIHVGEAGTLPSLIAENQKYAITDLKLTGNLNGTDIRFIREMAGRGYEGKNAHNDWWGLATDGKLANLDLSSANIVSGGDYYFNYRYLGPAYPCYTANNIISDFMFSGCGALNTIILPNSVTMISWHAFNNCTGLTSITIPNSVTSIGQGAFKDCKSLTSITIPNSVTSIGSHAFADCTSLISITIPNSITSIGSCTFLDCTGLTSITIPNSVTTIGDETFSGCTGLTSVIIPNSVTTIGLEAFLNCTSLTSVTIPNSVISIGRSAFESCTSLTSITIGNGVTSIGEGAFRNCTGLTEIHSKNPIPPSLYSNCFYNVNKTTCKVYVPKGSKSIYQSRFQWQEFENIFEVDDVSINSIDKDNISIQSIANAIVIETKEATPVAIYTLSGQKVYQSVIIGNVEINLNKGVYIVEVNNESQKVIVK